MENGVTPFDHQPRPLVVTAYDTEGPQRLTRTVVNDVSVFFHSRVSDVGRSSASLGVDPNPEDVCRA